jgi:UTP--glucose-1-phosphate uridylyltransferase
LFSNIDNLGATFDPAILGQHIASKKQMTIEVADKDPGDKGGAPAEVNGRLQLVEGFLFPESFDQDSIDVFNTASYIFSADALLQEFELPWYVVKKEVNGDEVLQFERLAGDLSRDLSIQCLRVERDERFLPVKTQSDAQKIEPFIRKQYGHLFN